MDTQPIADVVQKITDLIVEKSQPEAVYLYGSQATGNATNESDIDILVVLKNAKTPIDQDLDRSANALTHKLVDIKFVDPHMIDSYPAYKTIFTSGRRLFPDLRISVSLE